MIFLAVFYDQPEWLNRLNCEKVRDHLQSNNHRCFTITPYTRENPELGNPLLLQLDASIGDGFADCILTQEDIDSGHYKHILDKFVNDLGSE